MAGRKSYHDMILEESGLVLYCNFGAGAGSKAWDQISTNHGDITGATWTQETNNRQTLDFDGNDSIDCGNDASIRSSITVFTLEAWIKQPPTGDYHGLIATAKSNGRDGYRMGVDTNGNLAGLIGDASSFEHVIGTTVLDDDTWNQVVFTCDNSYLRIYVNGIIDQTPLARTKTITYDENLILGAWANLTNYYIGVLNEVVICNVALSAETILKHFQVGVWEGLAEA